MIYLLCVLAGAIAGAVGAYIACERTRRERDRVTPLDGVRWERVVTDVVAPAVKHLRRHYPTHELITDYRFLDLVGARGPTSGDVRQRCASWTVGMVMVDRRTCAISRIVLWNGMADHDEKTWILRRAGYKVTVMDRDIQESGLMEAMAA